MDKWFCSDNHFGHTNIIKYCSRPFLTVEEMNEHMIQEWNKCVKPNDEVYHNGDFAFMKYPAFKHLLSRLNGRIFLQRGNHDKMIVENKNDLLQQGKIVSIEHYRELKIAKKLIVLHHFGLRVWHKSHHGSIHLYGHSHGSLPPHGLSVDIGVDCKEITSDYRPIHLDEILTYMSKRSPAVVDHHNTNDM